MQYNFVNEPSDKSVTVITPTIGSKKLADAVNSVDKQTYKNIKHLVVIDGPEFFSNAVDNCPISLDSKVIIHPLPFNTGSGGFNGQRIYAAFPHLINSDYIFFLDEDNWYEPDHVETLVNLMQNKSLDWAYSFRKIFTVDREYVADDNCESLGKWPIYFTYDNPQYLIDTSAFAFTRSFIQNTCHLWHSGPWGEDRRYLNVVKQSSKWDTTGNYSLCYRLDGNSNSVKEDFFIAGNEFMTARYNNNFPWSKEFKI